MEAISSLFNTIIYDRIVASFLTLVTIINILPGMITGKTTYGPCEDDIILNCAVVSDTHADGNPVRDRSDILRQSYAGISRCSKKTDVVLNIGDVTNSGSRLEYKYCKRIMKTYLNSDTFIACMGNHDSWNGSADPDYEAAKKLFIDFINSYGNEAKNVYYCRIIKGYHFICIGTESLDIDGQPPVYSEAQIKWFEDEIIKAEKSGKPVFVLSHRPLNGRNGINSSGVIPQKFDEIMQAHSTTVPILFFSGHCHTFSNNLYEKSGNVHYFNLPSTEYNDETIGGPNDKGGMGLTMEVYEDKIIINARNFIKDKNIEGFSYEIPCMKLS